MTAMLVPPVRQMRDVGWKQVLGLEQGGSSFWQRVRGAQLEQLDRNVPFNVFLLGINIAVLLGAFGTVAPFPALLPWLAGIAGLSLLWSLRALRPRPAPEEVQASAAQCWRITAEVGALGLCWAGLLVTLMPALPADGQAVLMLFSLLFLGATTNCVATLAPAAVLLCATIGAGMVLAVPAAAPLDVPMVWVALASFILVKLRAALVVTHAMMARLKSEAELSEQGEVVRLLLNEYEANGSDWLLELDALGRLCHVTPRFADVARRRRGDLLGQPLLALLDPVAGGASTAALAHALNTRAPFRDLVVPVPLGRETRWWALSGTPKFDAGGLFAGFRGVGRDVTEARRAHERIALLARFDPLTGLANRSLFRETLDDVLERACRSGRPAALLFVDLDRFKAVNDCFGHAAGDLLLRQVAQRLQALVKGQATVARLGGDEFAIVLPHADAARAGQLAAQVVQALARPFPLGDDGRAGAAVVGASIGWALAPHDAATPEALLKAADLALYRVKEDGRGAALRFSADMAAAADLRRRLEADLADALARGELALAFQPIVDASDERITGFEALLRWRHPELGDIAPLDFVPLAEETGLIVPIGHWVIDAALAEAAHWPAHVGIAVNLSAAQMEDADLPDIISAALNRHGVAPARLELEITESLFLAEKPAIAAVLARLTAMGVSFALDDFGTGYSSLGTLKKASFSRIKIDRSFVQRAAANSDEAGAIIQTIVRLAASLDMATTAEGTETRAAFDLIRQLGCTQAQGWLFGKPMPPDAARQLVGASALV